MTQFGTLTKDGTLINVREIKQSDLAKCPFTIFDPFHYRNDGSCKCNDQEHRRFMMDNWEYTTEDFIEAGVVK